MSIQHSEDEAPSWICPVSYPSKMQCSEQAEALFSQDQWLENSFEQPRESLMPLMLSAEERSNGYSSSAPLKLGALSAPPADLHYSKEINRWNARDSQVRSELGSSSDPKACCSVKVMQQELFLGCDYKHC